MSDDSKNDKKPQGFTLTDEQMKLERSRAKFNDGGNNSNVTVTSYGFQVKEEEQQLGNNSSLQSVVLRVGEKFLDTPAANTVSLAGLSSQHSDRIYSLIGREDGRVVLNATKNLRTASFDITEAAAAAGITAAGIRRTEQDIAADGEVSRPEQVKIINLVDKAKALAGIR